MAIAALTVAACSSQGAPPGSGPSGLRRSRAARPTIALPASVPDSWIFPFYAITNSGVYNGQQFQWLMFRPLYMFGNNTDTSVLINYPLSPAQRAGLQQWRQRR